MRNDRFIVGKGVHRDKSSRSIKLWMLAVYHSFRQIENLIRLTHETAETDNILSEYIFSQPQCSRYHKTAKSSQIEFSLYGFGYAIGCM